MKRETARLLKALDRDILREARSLDILVRDRAALDPQGTKGLVLDILHSLTLEAPPPAKKR